MTNTDYFDMTEKRIVRLMELRKQGISLTKGIIGETLFKEDFFFCASADRCLNLIDGFTDMLRKRNLTCVGALLRLQMDNCMRSYAAFIARDKETVIDCIISGDSINKQLSKDGTKMTDGYLKRELSKVDTRFTDVYNQASGYIHLSEKAFYQTVVKVEDDSIEWQVGRELPEKRNSVLIEAADAFIHFVKLHFKMLEAVADSKRRVDRSDTKGTEQ
ncbi:MAG: hypothetical protein MR941_12725 [[Ruminococcus] gnavus]|nr:hypothetical protein [Mediterraneibacter gnavus]